MDYTTVATRVVMERTVEALAKNGMEGVIVEDGFGALEAIKKLIPARASVMNGSSKTLEQIGFVDYLKSGKHGWNNLHAGIVAEQDKATQASLRKQALLSDYYLGSVHALAETGEFVVASNTGSQLPHIVYSSPNLIFVVGGQKIVPTIADGLKRLEEHVVPMEDVRMKEAYGMGTQVSKVLLFKRENAMGGRKVHLILVNESLGF